MQSNAPGPIGLKHLQLRLDQRGGFPILVEDGGFWLTAQPDALASSLARSNGRPSSAHDDRRTRCWLFLRSPPPRSAQRFHEASMRLTIFDGSRSRGASIF
jgi:hypothetical protein